MLKKFCLVLAVAILATSQCYAEEAVEENIYNNPHYTELVEKGYSSYFACMTQLQQARMEGNGPINEKTPVENFMKNFFYYGEYNLPTQRFGWYYITEGSD